MTMFKTFFAGIAALIALGGCAISSPSLQLDVRAADEMPPEAALNFLKKWKAPNGASEKPIERAKDCSRAMDMKTVLMSDGKSHPYQSLDYIATIMTEPGNMRTKWKEENSLFIYLRNPESILTNVVCIYKIVYWVSGEPELENKVRAEASRLGTAFKALGARVPDAAGQKAN